VRRMRGKTTQDDVVCKTVLQDLKGLVCSKAIKNLFSLVEEIEALKCLAAL
jgi:hypothetical protein